MSKYIEVASIRDVDSSPSLVLFFDRRRYLFNCGEGTQRIFIESRIRIVRIEHMFLTNVTWEAMGGVTGFILTASDAGVARFNVVGPRGCGRVLSAAQHFLRRDHCELNIHEVGGNDVQSSMDVINLVHEDECVQVFAILSSSVATDTSTTSSHCSSTASSTIRSNSTTISKVQMSRSGWKQYDDSLQTTTPTPVTATTPPPVSSYIIKLHDTPGKFDAKRAEELGVFGKLRGALVRGETVQLDDGRRVAPAACVGPSLPGQIALVIGSFDGKKTQEEEEDGYYDAKQLNQFIQHGAWRLMQVDNDDDGDDELKAAGIRSSLIRVIYHLSSPYVTLSPLYQSFLAKFPASTQHVFFRTNQRPSSTVFFGANRHLKTLARLGSSVYLTYPQEQQEEVEVEVEVQEGGEAKDVDCRLRQVIANAVDANYHCARRGARCALAPSSSSSSPAVLIDESNAIALEEREAKRLRDELAVPLSATLVEQLAALRRQSQCSVLFADDEHRSAATSTVMDDADDRHISITFLGTSSALPCKYRNTSGILVHVGANDEATMLMDCGEGTLGQLKRIFPQPRYERILVNMTCIWISHKHADHHLGVIRLLSERAALVQQQLPPPPLLIIAPQLVLSFLTDFSAIEPLSFRPFRMDGFLTRENELSDFFATSMFASAAFAVPVVHCDRAYGLVIERADFKLVYSGDTMPSQALVDAGRNATLLIHEATFEDGLEFDAAAKRHSTTSQALEVARCMNAEHVILTHFSARYPHIPSFASGTSSSSSLSSSSSSTTTTTTTTTAAAAVASTSTVIPNVAISFDFMHFNFDQLHVLGILTPLVNELFKDDKEEEEVVDGDGDGDDDVESGRKKKKTKKK